LPAIAVPDASATANPIAAATEILPIFLPPVIQHFTECYLHSASKQQAKCKSPSKGAGAVIEKGGKSICHRSRDGAKRPAKKKTTGTHATGRLVRAELGEAAGMTEKAKVALALAAD